MIRFDIDKTIQAAAYLLKRQPSRCENYMRLLKLMYIAERTSLKERAVPICGDTPYAMRRGPVFSKTLDLIKGRDPLADRWAQFIEKRGYEILLKSDPGNLNLSRADIKILEAIGRRFQTFDEWAMVRWCHRSLPEYQKNWKGRGKKDRCRIPFEDVLSEIGRLGDQARIVAETNADLAFSRLFSDHMPTCMK